MTQLISIHAIVVDDPHVETVFSGRYKANGDAIMRKSTITIPPWSVFDIDPAVGEELVESGAARHPVPQEFLANGVIGVIKDAFGEVDDEARRLAVR